MAERKPSAERKPKQFVLAVVVHDDVAAAYAGVAVAVDVAACCCAAHCGGPIGRIALVSLAESLFYRRDCNTSASAAAATVTTHSRRHLPSQCSRFSRR